MNPWIEATGWTLIHFVWQGTLLTLATAAALGLCRRSAAQVRYVVACLGLTAMLVTAAATAVAGAFPGGAISFSSDRVPPVGRFESPIEASVGSAGQPLFAAREAVRRAANPRQLLPAVVWLWLAGVTVLMARLAAGCWRIHRLRAATMAAPLSSWQPAAERLARRLRVAVPFRIVESAVVDAPILIGWLQPLVVLPLAAMAHMTAAQVEALVAHELAHIRRRDYAINLLQTIAEALLFFHPGVWWVSRRIREEREHCCDDAAIAVAGEATAYAEALMALASWREREFQPSLGAAKGSLVLRIRRLLSIPDEAEPSGRGGLVVLGTAVALAAAVMVLSMVSSATAQSPAQTDAAERRVRRTDHFEIYYAPSLDLHAERIAGEAERAYERVSGDLRHNLGFTIPLVLFESAADLERSSQTAAASAPLRAGDQSDRILFRVDVPADQWLGLLTHEVAHVFGFDILPATRRQPGSLRALPNTSGTPGIPTTSCSFATRFAPTRCHGSYPFSLPDPKSDSSRRSATRPSISSSHAGAKMAFASSCSRCAGRRAAAEIRTKRRSACRPGTSSAGSTATCANASQTTPSPPRRESPTPGQRCRSRD